MTPIYVDFLKRDSFGRVKLTTIGTREDLAAQGIELHEGMRLVFWSDDADNAGARHDLLADGVVMFNESDGVWVADIDENSFRHVSDES